MKGTTLAFPKGIKKEHNEAEFLFHESGKD